VVPSLDEILGDNPEPRDALSMDDLRRRAGLSWQDTDRLEAEGYLDPVYVVDKDFMVAGEQAKRVIALVHAAKKAGGRFPPTRPALADAARARFVRSSTPATFAADLLEPYRYTSLQRVWPRILELATPALRLRAAPPGAATRSRVGGVPDLPPGTRWPSRQDSPLSFIAQVDLSGVARWYPGSPLPPSDLLSFFYDSQHQPWGYDPAHRGGWAVYQVDQSAAAPSEPPEDLAEGARFSPLPVQLVPEVKLPPYGSKAVDDLELRAREQVAYSALLGDLEEAQHDDGEAVHRLLGHPDPIQGDMQRECQLAANGIDDSREAAESEEVKRLLAERGAWRLLLQIDSDERTGMQWGEDGRIYVWMRDPDLAARRWSEAWLSLQCS